jgi:hypothetical protein
MFKSQNVIILQTALNCLYAQKKKLGKNNNPVQRTLHRECFIEKQRKRYKKQPFDYCRRS